MSSLRLWQVDVQLTARRNEVAAEKREVSKEERDASAPVGLDAFDAASTEICRYVDEDVLSPQRNV